MPSEERGRQRRLSAIVSILRDEEITSQGELVERLQGRGFKATQSSISRDLNDLRVAKVAGKYIVPSLPNSMTAHELVAEGLVSFHQAGPNLMVVRTRPACAGRVGMLLDKLDMAEIVGTVCGHDTIMVATVDRSDQQHVMDFLDRALQA